MYAAPLDYQAQCACVKCVELTCLISCGFYVVNVQLWQTAEVALWRLQVGVLF